MSADQKQFKRHLILQLSITSLLQLRVYDLQLTCATKLYDVYTSRWQKTKVLQMENVITES